MRWAMLVVAVLGFGAAALGIGVWSIDAAHAGVDEPQYLLSAISLAEDGNLDISDELGVQRWRDFSILEPPPQTEVLAGGRQISPHDPLLPLLIALPVKAGGWIAAKWTLAVVNGLLAAAMLALAVNRFGVPLRIAAPGVGLAATSAPLAVYGQQVYPELPAALVVVLGVYALTGRRLGWLWLCVAALPWLSIKYAPVAAALALCALVPLVRNDRRTAAWLAAGWAAAGAAYVGIHELIWGGWTVYASGDEFARSGEFGVVGFRPDYPGRTIRVLGLLIDRDFGLAAWQPAWLLVIPAVTWLFVRRPPHWQLLAAPLLAGWANATWVALTMQGYWWPGRQVVVVLPLAVVAVLVWIRKYAWLAGLLALTGVLLYLRVVVDGLRSRATTWIHAPDDTRLHPVLAWLLPDDRVLATPDVVKYALWAAAAVVAAAVVVVQARRAVYRPSSRSSLSGSPNV